MNDRDNGVACNVPDFIEAKKLLKCFKTVAINISQENCKMFFVCNMADAGTDNCVKFAGVYLLQ